VSGERRAERDGLEGQVELAANKKRSIKIAKEERQTIKTCGGKKIGERKKKVRPHKTFKMGVYKPRGREIIDNRGGASQAKDGESPQGRWKEGFAKKAPSPMQVQGGKEHKLGRQEREGRKGREGGRRETVPQLRLV